MPSFWPILAFDMSSSFLVFLLKVRDVCPVLSPEHLKATVRVIHWPMSILQYLREQGGPRKGREMGEQ